MNWRGAIGEVENDEGDEDDYNDPNGDNVTIGSSTIAAGADTTANDVPDAVYRLQNPVSRRDGVGISYENVVDDDKSDESEMDKDEEEEPEVETVGGITAVRLLSLDFFRSKLITHFAIALKRNESSVASRIEEVATSEDLDYIVEFTSRQFLATYIINYGVLQYYRMIILDLIP